MEIKRAGSQGSNKGPADWFTGNVRIEPLFEAPGIITFGITRRLCNMANLTATCPELAPAGWHLYVAYGVPIPAVGDFDEAGEIAALRTIQLTIHYYRGDLAGALAPPLKLLLLPAEPRPVALPLAARDWRAGQQTAPSRAAPPQRAIAGRRAIDHSSPLPLWHRPHERARA